MVKGPSNVWIQNAPTFEQRLENDSRWALSEGSRFLDGNGAVQVALRKITKLLNELEIPYAVVGGMALFQHGYRRFTDDVDILVTRDGLRAIHAALDGRGYVRLFEKSKNLRDAETGVKIEFLVAGEFPGDGKRKPVQFPDPDSVFVERDGIRFLNLPTLVELKLASGISGSDRIKDLADVQELIKTLNLPADLAASLDESVRQKYMEIWRDVHRQGKRYLLLWRNNSLPTDAKSLGEMINTLQETAETLRSMLADGVTLAPDGGTSDDYAYLVTTDPDIARKYGMQDEAEYLADEDEVQS